MPETLNLNYYYGNEADQHSFYRIPKILLTDRRYKGVSLEARVLYGLLLDRMGLSARNGWLDDNGRVFLYFIQEEVIAMLDCGKDKATKLFRELILENIEYDILLERNPYDKDLLDGYVELMLEVCCSTRESVRSIGKKLLQK